MRKVHFANDRYGLRPLFHLQHKGRDFLGSSIASMLEASGKQAELNEFARFTTCFPLRESGRVIKHSSLVFERSSQGRSSLGVAMTSRNGTYWDYQFEPAAEAQRERRR